jgi:hypothetical protein
VLMCKALTPDEERHATSVLYMYVSVACRVSYFERTVYCSALCYELTLRHFDTQPRLESTLRKDRIVASLPRVMPSAMYVVGNAVCHRVAHAFETASVQLLQYAQVPQCRLCCAVCTAHPAAVCTA